MTIVPDGEFKVLFQQVLFGTYFFYSQEKIEHFREVYTYVNILTELGGLYECLILIFGAFGYVINSQLLRANYIQILYY